MEPSFYPIGLNVKSPSLHDLSQAHPSIVECPKGKVPILRNRRRDPITSLNFDQVINKDTQQEVGILISFLE
jgi:hypothetical protein